MRDFSLFFVLSPSDEYHQTPSMISQHCFIERLGAVSQQAINRATVDPDLCRHMASLCNNGLNQRLYERMLAKLSKFYHIYILTC